MNIDWLMGFIEAKGCFTISHQTIPKIKKYTQKYINNLKKEASIAEIQYLSKDGRIFTKDFLDYPLDIVNFLKNLITTYSFSRDYLIKRDLETLKETLLTYAKDLYVEICQIHAKENNEDISSEQVKEESEEFFDYIYKHEEYPD